MEKNYQSYVQKDAQRFEIREGGGSHSVFGFPFFCAGVFLLLVSLKIIPLTNRSEVPSWTWIVMFFMSFPFVGIGGWLLFGRRQTRIDLTDGRIFKEWRVFVPAKSETHLIVDYKTVSIRLESGDSESPDTYPVSLLPANNGRPLPLYTGGSYSDSREFAAAVSQFLKFPLEDMTAGHKSLVEPGDTKKSLKERLANESGSERVPRPVSMKCEMTEESGILRIRIPPAGFKGSVLVPYTIPILFFLYLIPRVPSAITSFQKSHTPVVVQCFLLGAVALFLTLALVQLIKAVIASLHDDTVVQVGLEELVIAERKSLKVKTTRIPVQEIYDVDYSGKDSFTGSFQDAVSRSAGGDPEKERQLLLKQQEYANAGWVKALQKLACSKGIIFKTRRALFTIGAGLEDEELGYLCSLIKNKIAKS